MASFEEWSRRYREEENADDTKAAHSTDAGTDDKDEADESEERM